MGINSPGRRTPAAVGTRCWKPPNEMVEVKGAKRDTQGVDRRFEREGKNDVLFNLLRMDGDATLPEDFVWVIKTQDGVDGYKAAFEKLLGKATDKDPLGEIDEGLRTVLQYMEKYDEERYKLALTRLKKLRDKLTHDELVLLGNVDRTP